MDIKNLMEKFYKNTPLEKISWNKTQADYFLELLNSGKLGQGEALDLGCGVGAKSIALAQKGFRVTGVDISPTAISYAQEKAEKTGVKVKFIASDATDLSFLANETFDFVLDWACFHCIPKTKRKKYIDEIADHTKRRGKFLLRCFSKRGVNKESVFRPAGRVYLFSEKDIGQLFNKKFKILKTNSSKPFQQNPPGKWLDEYLMEKL